MHLKIEKPFHLHLDVVETDDHVPSMRIRVTVDVQHSGHNLNYEAHLWFDCTVWDDFVTALSNVRETETHLTDMSNCLSLRLSATSGNPEIAWEMKKIALTGATVTTAFRSPLDEDTLVHVTERFIQFERWW